MVAGSGQVDRSALIGVGGVGVERIGKTGGSYKATNHFNARVGINSITPKLMINALWHSGQSC